LARRKRIINQTNNDSEQDEHNEFYRASVIRKDTVLDIQVFGEIPHQDDPDVIELIDLIETTEADRLVITVMSYGGSMYSSLAIYSALQSRKEDMEIITIANGMVASGAYYIYMAGTKRYVYPFAMMLIHDASMDTGFRSIANIGEVTKGIEKLSDKIMEETVTDYVSEHEKNAIKAGRDLYISADEAVERGISHEIISPSNAQEELEQLVEQCKEEEEGDNEDE